LLFYLVALPEIGQKMYVDPMNYVDAETALKEFANEIDPALLSLERLIGGGSKSLCYFIFCCTEYSFFAKLAD
jgi:hypothetical protein